MTGKSGIPALPQANQGVVTNPGRSGVLRGEHCDEGKRFGAYVDERMRHSGRYFRHVGRFDRQRVLAYPVLGASLEKHVRLFGVVYMQSGATARMGLGNDERKRLEAVLIASEAIGELTRHTVVVLELIKGEEVGGRIVRFRR